jgi:hypothetical protein
MPWLGVDLKHAPWNLGSETEHARTQTWQKLAVHAFMPGSPRRPIEWLQSDVVTWLSQWPARHVTVLKRNDFMTAKGQN